MAKKWPETVSQQLFKSNFHFETLFMQIYKVKYYFDYGQKNVIISRKY